MYCVCVNAEASLQDKAKKAKPRNPPLPSLGSKCPFLCPFLCTFLCPFLCPPVHECPGNVFTSSKGVLMPPVQNEAHTIQYSTVLYCIKADFPFAGVVHRYSTGQPARRRHGEEEGDLPTSTRQTRIIYKHPYVDAGNTSATIHSSPEHECLDSYLSELPDDPRAANIQDAECKTGGSATRMTPSTIRDLRRHSTEQYSTGDTD